MKLEARLGVAFGFGMFENFGKISLSKNEHDYIPYAQNYICHSYVVILVRSACLSRYAQTRFPWDARFLRVFHV